MSIIEIRHRFTGAVLWSGKAESLGDAVEKAVVAKFSLARANLARAYLAGAYLAGANLAGADLAGADLTGADLARANLARANLADANLDDASLDGAYLAGADLAGADLARADLAGADLADANLDGALNYDASTYVEPTEHVEPTAPYVRDASGGRMDAMMRYRTRHPEVPVVEKLDAKILDAITSGGGSLNMLDWHSCETTHCRAGWAIHLAGKAGYELEARLGSPEYAGRAIYRASTGRVPDFYASNERALEDIKRCAKEDEQELVAK